MWGPPVISWFISPSNYSYEYNKSYIGVMFTNLAILGASHCINHQFQDVKWPKGGTRSAASKAMTSSRPSWPALFGWPWRGKSWFFGASPEDRHEKCHQDPEQSHPLNMQQPYSSYSMVPKYVWFLDNIYIYNYIYMELEFIYIYICICIYIYIYMDLGTHI